MISIIAILAGLLLPVISKVTQNAYKVQAKTAETQIIAAIKSYQTDYGTYPVPPSLNSQTVETTDWTYTPSSGNAPLFNVLRALNTDSVYNTRKVVYFEGNDAKSASQPKAGFVPTSSAGGNIGNRGSGTTGAAVNVGDFLDPWGNEYCIRIDSGYTNAVYNPYVAGNETTQSADDTGTAITAQNQAQFLLLGVAVWSHGADGALGVYNGSASALPPTSDDVVSWQ